MSRLLLESGPPDALALEDGSGVVLLEDVDAALERRDPLYVRIDRPNWRISWVAGFNVNLQGVVVAPPEALPTGLQLTELPPQGAPRQLNQRTWLWNYNPNLIAQDRMTAGARLSDRPGVPPYYREWSQNLLQWTLTPRPVGAVVIDLAPRASPLQLAQRTWTWQYNLNLIGKDQLPVGYEVTDRPGVPPWYRSLETNLQQTTLVPAIQRPLFNVEWPVPRAHQHSIALRTWINVGVPQELFPSFVTGWDTGQGVDWRRSWVQNLLQSTLSTPPVVLPAGRSITDRPGVPPWYRAWLVSLQQTTLAPAPVTKPAGAIVVDRPAVLRWFHSWLVSPLRAAAIVPFAQTDWPLPRSYPQGRTWLQNLLQTTLAPAAPKPVTQTDWPLPRAYPFGPDLRTWTAFYNRNLIGRDARVAGQAVTARPAVPPWYRTWSENLLERTLAPAPGTPPVAIVTELPPRGHQHPVALRTWINVGVPQELFPSFVTGWDIGRDVYQPAYRSWTLSLTYLLPPAEKPFAQLAWPPGSAPVFMPSLRTLTARHNFDLVDVFPEPPVEPPEPGVGGEITAGYFSKKKWHDLRALINAEKAAAAHAEQLKRSAAKKTLQAAVKATEEIVQGIHAGEGMPVIEPLQMALEAAASARRLSDVLSNAKRAVRLAQRAKAEMDMDEEDEAIALMLLS